MMNPNLLGVPQLGEKGSEIQLQSLLHSFENEKNPEVYSQVACQNFLKIGFPKTTLAFLSFPLVRMSDLMMGMSYENHLPMLSTLLNKCPILYEYLIKPRLTLSGLSNTSIVPNKDGTYLLNVRAVNYLLNDQAQFLLPEGAMYFESHNIFLQVASDLKNVLYEKKFEQTWNQDCKYRGIEDIRILENNEKLYYIGTICHENRLMMAFGEYNVEKKTIDINPIYSPYYRQVEKNWSMFNNKDGEISFVYQWFPLEIGKIKGNKLDIVHQKDYGWWFMSRIKGSSCGFFEEETNLIWFMVHFHSDDTPRQYYHMFILLNPENYDIVKISSPFLFENTKVQFGMGLIVEKERIIITYTVFDRDARVASFDKQKVMDILWNPQNMVFTCV